MKRIFTAFLTSFFLLSFSINSQAQLKALSNELIWGSKTFAEEKVQEFNSMVDGEHYTALEVGTYGTQINQYSFKTGELVKTLLASPEIFRGGNQIENYDYSEAEEVIIVKTGVEKIYRHSDKADYVIYNIADQSVKPLSDFDQGKISLGTLAPGGKHFAFVRDNNIFYVDLTTMTEKQITFDGKENEIINGAVDWVYEEEFSNDRGFYWSPAGDRIAYYRFNESQVKTFMLTKYGELYPERNFYKYPKAGEANSKVSIHVYDVTTDKTTDLQTNHQEYIPRIKWTQSNDNIVVMLLNRHQNHLEFVSFNVAEQSPTAKVIYNENSETYININDNLIFLDDGKHFIWNSERNDYNHIYMYNLEGELVKQLTFGNWDVDSFLGVDQKRKRVYFTAAVESPKNTSLYYVKLKGGEITKLSENEGSNSADFSEGFNYYLSKYSNINRPTVYSLHDADGKLIRMLKDNQKLVDTLKKYRIGTKEFFNFVTERGDTLTAYVIKPTNFNESLQYPVLLSIYGGPESITVTNSWGGRNFLWASMVAEQGVIVVGVDPRGTKNRGHKFKHQTYLKLGEYETEDFISAARFMKSKPYVNPNKIGIFGWSYGGFMALNCITQGADEFTTAVSVAPVTNWRYYDNIYTERYMRTPQENPKGYDNNSPINHTEKMKGTLLLVHGDADDNVHVQNTMDMVSALVKGDKQFELFIYPNKNHGINGGNTRKHLFEMITDFLKENL